MNARLVVHIASALVFLIAGSGLGRTARADPGGVHVTMTGKRAAITEVTSRSFATASGPGGTATVSGVSYRSVCSSPCDLTLDPSRDYFVGSHPLTFSHRLRLDGQGPEVEVHVKRRGRYALRMLGVGLMGAGLAMMIAGPVALAGGSYKRAGGFILGFSFPVTGLGIAALILGKAKATVRARRR